eukprot:bmy_16732T0
MFRGFDDQKPQQPPSLVPKFKTKTTKEIASRYGSACIFWLSSGQKHSDVVAGLVPVIAIVSGTQRNEEIEAMAAIYGEEWCVIDDCAKIFCIRISDDIDDPKWTLCLQVMLPNEYPVLLGFKGKNVQIYRIALRKYISCQPENPVKALDFDVSENRTEIEELPPIDHGIPITDRRSTFQAHLAPVVCPKQVKMVLAKLYENKKIASATHNIYAYRIYCEDKQTFLQDCEDDGETAAGGRLLHLMEEESSKTLGKNKKRSNILTCMSKPVKEDIKQLKKPNILCPKSDSKKERPKSLQFWNGLEEATLFER